MEKDDDKRSADMNKPLILFTCTQSAQRLIDEERNAYLKFLRMAEEAQVSMKYSKISISASYMLSYSSEELMLKNGLSRNSSLVEIFLYYCRTDMPPICKLKSFADMKAARDSMSFQSFASFCRDFLVTPHFVTYDEVSDVWSALRLDGHKTSTDRLDFDSFKESLLRLALIMFGKSIVGQVVEKRKGHMTTKAVLKHFCTYLHLGDEKYVKNKLSRIDSQERNRAIDTEFKPRNTSRIRGTEFSTRTLKVIEDVGRETSNIMKSPPVDLRALDVLSTYCVPQKKGIIHYESNFVDLGEVGGEQECQVKLTIVNRAASTMKYDISTRGLHLSNARLTTVHSKTLTPGLPVSVVVEFKIESLEAHKTINSRNVTGFIDVKVFSTLEGRVVDIVSCPLFYRVNASEAMRSSSATADYPLCTFDSLPYLLRKFCGVKKDPRVQFASKNGPPAALLAI